MVVSEFGQGKVNYLFTSGNTCMT